MEGGKTAGTRRENKRSDEKKGKRMDIMCGERKGEYKLEERNEKEGRREG